MIYQSGLQPINSASFVETPIYTASELESEMDLVLKSHCPELLVPEFRIQFAHFATLLYFWKNPPEDQHDWIGFASDNQRESTITGFYNEPEIEVLLSRNEILSGSKYGSKLGLAAQAEKNCQGVTSFLLGMFADRNEKIPGEYFDLCVGFSTDSVIMKKSLFHQFMEWLIPLIQHGSEKIKSDEFLIRHPENGMAVVLDQLFIIWYLKNNWTIYDLESKTSFVCGSYETKLPTSQVSLGCVNYKRQADENLIEASRTGRIANGRFVEELENQFCETLDVKHAIAVCNGTMADAIALSAIAYKTEIRNVIIPALSFIAQANAILHAGLNPVFVDVGPDGLMENIADLAERRDCIVYPVHLMGKVCRSVSQLDSQYPVLEDACEALGSRVDGKYAGTMGMAGTFSMYVSHSFTSGEGGMIVTSDDEIADLCKSIRAHGRMGDSVKERFRFPRLGFNGKMSNLQAAFATAHFDDFEEIIEKRKQIVQMLSDRLGDDFGVASNDVVAHGFPVMYADKSSRDRALNIISQNGIECRPMFSCIASEHFNTGGDFPNAENISSRFLYVPCHHQLSENDIELICQAVHNSQKAEFI